MRVQSELHSIPRRPDAEGDTEVARQTTDDRRGAMGRRLFTGLGRHHYPSRAGDVIPIPMANDPSNCLRLALYGNGQADRPRAVMEGGTETRDSWRRNILRRIIHVSLLPNERMASVDGVS